jgi:hypothetical protein
LSLVYTGAASPATSVWTLVHNAKIFLGGVCHLIYCCVIPLTSSYKGVMEDADRAGTKPNMHLMELVKKGTQELVSAYARMCKPEEENRPREIMEESLPEKEKRPREIMRETQPTQPVKKRAFSDNCVCM